MKIQISFACLKNCRSIFNENTVQFFLLRKNFRSVFNENTNRFFDSEKFSDLYL